MPTYINKGNYLLVEINEGYSFKMLKETVHQIIAHSKKENLGKVLVDLTNMDGEFKTIDRYEIGLEIAKVWGQGVQVATVARESQVNFLVENVAVNRGAKLRVFIKIEPALEWLSLEQE